MRGFSHKPEGYEDHAIDTINRRYTPDEFSGKKYVANLSLFMKDWREFIAFPWNAIFFCEPTLIELGYMKITAGPRYRQWAPGMRLYCQSIGAQAVVKFSLLVMSYDPGRGDCEFLVDCVDGGAGINFGSMIPLTQWSASPSLRSDMPAAGGNIAVANGGTGSSLIRTPFAAREALNLTSPLLTVAEQFEDFIEFVNPDYSNFPWKLSKSGAGALLVTDDQPSPLAVGTAFAGIATLRTSSNTEYVQIERIDSARGAGTTLANNDFEFLARINIENLADVTNDYQFQIGFGGYQASQGVDIFGYAGFGFEYNRSVSANWRCKVGNAGSITASTTGTAVATGWTVLGISKTGSTMTFTVNGVSVYTPVSGYPTTNTGQNMCGQSVLFRRTAGTSVVRNVHLDYLWCRHLATGR